MKTKTNKKPTVAGWDSGYPIIRNPQFIGTKYHELPLRRMLASGKGNTKTAKNTFQTATLSMSPHKMAHVGNVCPGASAACVKACLNETGLGSVFDSIQAYRQAKTIAWQLVRDWAIERITKDLQLAEKRLGESDLLACRLNVFSDIRFERYLDLAQFERTIFYDYSKIPGRYGLLAPNYWVTFSRSETNEAQAIEALENGANVAIVFYDDSKPATGNRAQFQRLPKTWRGFQVFDADKTDQRFLDPRGRKRGRVAGLRLKASTNAKRAEAIASGFAVKVR